MTSAQDDFRKVSSDEDPLTIMDNVAKAVAMNDLPAVRRGLQALASGFAYAATTRTSIMEVAQDIVTKFGITKTQGLLMDVRNHCPGNSRLAEYLDDIFRDIEPIARSHREEIKSFKSLMNKNCDDVLSMMDIRIDFDRGIMPGSRDVVDILSIIGEEAWFGAMLGMRCCTTAPPESDLRHWGLDLIRDYIASAPETGSGEDEFDWAGALHLIADGDDELAELIHREINFRSMGNDLTRRIFESGPPKP